MTHARARAHTHTHTHGMMPMGWTKQYEFECCFVYVVTTPKVYRVSREVMGGSRARIVRNKKNDFMPISQTTCCFRAVLLEQRLEQVTSQVSTAQRSAQGRRIRDVQQRKGDEFVTPNASVLAADLQEFFCDALLSHSDAAFDAAVVEQASVCVACGRERERWGGEGSVCVRERV